MEKTLFYEITDLYKDPSVIVAAAAECAEKNGTSATPLQIT